MKQIIQKTKVKIKKIWNFIRIHRLKIAIILLLPFIFTISFRQILDKTVKKRNRPIEYIAVHWTANTNVGANASANAYYLRKKRAAGTHFCIDDQEVVLCTEEENVAYAVGDRYWRGFKPKPWLVNPNGSRKILNNNSMSYEMCLGGDRNDSLIIDRTAQLIGWQLVNKGLDISRVIRHHDVTGKPCPRFTYATTLEWDQVKEDSCFNEFKRIVDKYYQINLFRKQMWRATNEWTDTIPPLIGQTTLKFEAK